VIVDLEAESAPPAGHERRRALRVASALSLVDPAGADVVVCHDAARPFAAPATFRAVVEALRRWDGAVPGLRIADTVKRVDGERVVATEPRESLVLVQTPQAFRAAALVDAHHRAVADGRVFSDDAGCLESAGYTVGVVPGDPSNFKITDRDDLRRATSILETAGG
jgi:2-C-methyl-D-erythritol 4-phosphate cytidylyltransferase